MHPFFLNIFAIYLHNAVHFSDALMHLHRPRQPLSLWQPQRTNSWQILEASGSFVHTISYPSDFLHPHSVRSGSVASFKSDCANSRKLDKLPCIYAVLEHRASGYSIRQAAFSCKQIFMTFIDVLTNTGPIIEQYYKPLYSGQGSCNLFLGWAN